MSSGKCRQFCLGPNVLTVCKLREPEYSIYTPWMNIVEVSRYYYDSKALNSLYFSQVGISSTTPFTYYVKNTVTTDNLVTRGTRAPSQYKDRLIYV